ncbi:MAG: hypothetical protein ACK5AZ_06865 [Bryobacteraceae bacterium]
MVELGTLLDFWSDLDVRLHGPGRLRFIIQPALAILLGIRDGWNDAKAGKPPHLLDLLFDRAARRQRAAEGLRAVAVPLLVATVIDAIVQYALLGTVHVGAAILVGVCLVGGPYIAVRGPANRFRRRRLRLERSPPENDHDQ